MKVIKISCEGCGAALQAQASDHFITCDYCHTRMALVPTAPSPEEIGKLTGISAGLTANVRKLQLESDLLRLDNTWENYRETVLPRSQDGKLYEPSQFVSVLAGCVMIIIGVLGGIGCLAMGGDILNVAGPLWILLWIVIGWSVFSKNSKSASEYAGYRNRYFARRGILIRQITELTRSAVA